MSIREFCRRRRLKESQFYWWQRRLRLAQQVGAGSQRSGVNGQAASFAAAATGVLWGLSYFFWHRPAGRDHAGERLTRPLTGCLGRGSARRRLILWIAEIRCRLFGQME
jgi:hypothetical protein